MNQQAHIQGVSTRSADNRVRAIGMTGIPKTQVTGSARPIAPVAAADHLVGEAPIVRQIVEVRGPAQQQPIEDRRLQVAVGALDRPVLMCDAAVVAARRHAVVLAQGVIAARQILPGVGVQVAEGRRQNVAAMVRRRPAQGPERVLQPLGQDDLTLAPMIT